MSVQSSEVTPEVAAQPRSRRKQIIILGSILVLAVLLFVGFLLQDRLLVSLPIVDSLTTAHGLEDGTIVDETRVFDTGEDVFLVFSLERGRTGHTVSVQIHDAEGPVEAEGLRYDLPEQDFVREAVTFTPPESGAYTATLLLDSEPVEDAEVVFKVVEGGPPLEEVATTTQLNAETFEPEAVTDTFSAQDTIYITYRVVDAQPGDTLSIRYSIDGEVQPSDPFDHTQFEEEGNFRGHFSLQGRVSNELPAGDYRAELFYNEDMVAVANFAVTAPSAGSDTEVKG